MSTVDNSLTQGMSEFIIKLFDEDIARIELGRERFNFEHERTKVGMKDSVK